MANPLLSRNNNFNNSNNNIALLEQSYNSPSYRSEPAMTYGSAIKKTSIVFAVMLLLTPVGLMFPILALPAALIGLVLVLVNVFKKKPSKALTLSYAVVEGIFVGGITAIFETLYPGVAAQAVLASLVTVAVVLALFANGKIRASAKATKIFMIAMISYLAFSLVNVGLVVFNVIDTPFGINGVNIPGTSIPLGLVIGGLAVLLASYSLVLDFDFIKTGVQNKVSDAEGWNAALGILITVVWLYTEFLRIFSLLRN